VVIGTPIDLRRLIAIGAPTVRVQYDLQEIGKPDLGDALAPLVSKLGALAAPSR
jgi:predicted GTPase